MLTVQGLSKSYGPISVLDDVSFSLNRGQRSGLVGANGVGKSTLLKILAGIEVADTGRLSYVGEISSGYLPQTHPILEGFTIGSLIEESVSELRELSSRMQHVEKAMSTATGTGLSSLIKEYGELSGLFEIRGGYEIDYRIDKVLEGLGIGYLDKSRMIDTLSGGEKTRVGMAALLIKSPDLLILDEPTSHLDIQTLDWLENYLITFKGALIIASHDRQFLNTIVTEILEIDEHAHRLKKYSGNYDAYKTAKESECEKWEEDYRSQQEEIRQLNRTIKTSGRASSTGRKPRDSDKFVVHFKQERTQKASSKVIHQAQTRLQRIEENPIPKPPRPLQFKAGFRSQTIRSAAVIKASGVSKSFDGRAVLNNINFTLGHNSRTIITGSNGTGKTTLLRILTSMDTTDAGEIKYAPKTKIGFLPQEPQFDSLNISVLEYFGRDRAGHQDNFIFELLYYGMFRRDDLNKKVKQLSLGQRRKLELARIIAEEPNTLILDEPTNYLSLDVLEAFEGALLKFQGPVLAVSHDRRFVKKFGSQIWELKDGVLAFRGDPPQHEELQRFPDTSV